MSNKPKIIHEIPPKQSGLPSVSVNIPTKKPIIDFRYLAAGNKCWKHVHKCRPKTDQFNKFCDLFQDFIISFSDCERMSAALSRYSSHKKGGPMKYDVSFLPKNIQSIARDEVVHLHLKANGNGKERIWGFSIENVFYIIEFDLEH